MIVTAGIIALNEEKYLPGLLADLRRQTYPHDQIEVILVDSGSGDGTKRIMEAFREDNGEDFRNILLLDNPEGIQATGWNAVIRNASGDAIVRIDAHCTIQEDFIERNVACLESGEAICGGPVTFLTDDLSAFGRMLLDAETSSFGSGPAEYRQEAPEKKYVRSVFKAAYRREVFNRVGCFREDLIRTEDNELHWRMIRAGYRICFDPSIRSGHYIRSGLGAMLRQKFGNGYWIGRTVYICPGCLSAFHLLPMLFLLSVILGTALAFSGRPALLAGVGAAYMAIMIINALRCVFRTGNAADLLLPAVCLLIHFSYGAGTVCGLAAGGWRKCTAERKN